MKKKFLSSRFLVVLAVAGVTAACGGNPGGTAQQSNSAAASAGSAELEPVELTWHFMGNYPQEGQDDVFAAANQMIKEKINATVNFVPSAFGDYDQKMQVIIGSGEEFDICFTSDWTNNYIQNVSKGAFVPLDDLIGQYAKEAAAAIPESMWDATRVKGKIYGFINQQISARTPNMNTRESYYNKYKDVSGTDIKQLSGKIYADTMNQLEPYIKAVIEGEGGPGGGGYYFLSNLYSLEGSFFNVDYISSWAIPGAVTLGDESLRVINQYKDAPVKTYAALMRDWNAKGFLNAQERISKKTDDDIAGQENRGVMYLGATYKPGVEVQDSASSGEPVIAMPAGTPYLTTSAIIADLQAISITSKNPERAMMLINLVNTDAPLFNTLIAGVEGKNWNMNADGFLQKTDPAYVPNSDWMFGTNFLAYVQVGQPKNIWEQTKEINSSAPASPLLGFSFDPEPIKNEISQCTAVTDEYARGIELGVYDETKYEEFLNKLDTAGADVIIAEMQKQIDAWKATK